MKRGVKYGLIAFLLLVVAGVVAPFIRVSQYREQIRLGLERSLHRKVEIYGDAHLNLFRGPGFSVEKVVIYDDPHAGLEPLANVAELQTTVALSSLLTGRLAFNSVRFVEPSVNLVKPDGAPWNALGLLAGAAAPSGQRLPQIEIIDGRINFKFGQTKSAFYLTDTNLTVTPTRNGAEVRFSWAPARTDRTRQGYGLFSGRGRVENGRIELDAQLEKSPLEELITLVRGQSLGVHGVIQSRARISGPVSHPEITGRVELEDVHRWDLQPGRAGVLSTDYKGSFDAGTQRFEVTASKPFAARLLVEHALSRPEWLAEVGIEKMPASGLAEFARHMGVPLPPSMTTEGDVAGSVSYSSATGMAGRLTVENAVFRVEGGPDFRMGVASLEITGDQIRLLPADLDDAELDATYAPFRQRLEARLRTRSMKIAPNLYGVPVPMLDRFRGGTWGGTLHYLAGAGEPGAWTASIGLRDTETSVPGLASPLKIAFAEVEVEGGRLEVRRLRASAGPVELSGDYLYEPEEARPHQFHLTIPSADTGELEKLLQPVLLRGGSSFLARTLRWRQPLPDWLKDRRAAGEIRIGTLTAGEWKLRSVRSRVIWNGALVQFSEVQARVDEGSMAGKVSLDLSKALPWWSMTGTMKNLAWRSGQVDLDGSVRTSGAGPDLLLNLKADGKFVARSVSVAPETLKTASGTFELTAGRAGAQIRLSSVQAEVGAERFSGEGSTQPDGRLQVDLSSPTRMLRVSGPIAAPKLAIMELPAYGPVQRQPEAR
ncbi:MAG: AsmA family protein [Bryobacteraceae bacterium]|nr:AsmA family protein [Bryobacteraceae bacterium]